MTRQVRTRARRRRLAALAAVLSVCLIAAVSFHSAADGTREQGASAVREAVLSAAKQCCAIEGSYPSTLSHLEDSYGLTINHHDYVVNYEWYADNVMPSVVVVPR
ncbi:MAG: hypothetical protein LKK57_05695 [Atopobiaceae bacterium]|nr:hypothetical protein [Atopobiaceae bacterium]